MLVVVALVVVALVVVALVVAAVEGPPSHSPLTCGLPFADQIQTLIDSYLVLARAHLLLFTGAPSPKGGVCVSHLPPACPGEY